MSLRIGETFAEYRILRLLGSGGMGEVYLVQHPRLPRQDALKVLRPDISSDLSFRERFIREADLAAGLRHPHIVGIHDRGEYDGQLWIAMDYIDGTDAAQLLEQKYPAGMPPDLVVRVATAVSSALDYAHGKNLLHRDVKPANVIVTDHDSKEPNVYLADFGIARTLDDTSGITTTNMTVGTVAYAAPEQLMGERMDGRADQYALAATAYHLLTGSQLFPHSNPAVVISHHLNSNPPTLGNRRPDCATLEKALKIGLAKTPADRFPSCSVFAQALLDESPSPEAGFASAPTQVAAKPRGSAPTTAATPNSESPVAASWRTWAISASVAAIGLLIAVLAFALRPWDSGQSIPDGTASSSTTAFVSAPPPPPERPPNPAGEASFVADVRANIPTADIPGGRPTDTRLVAYGYQACSVMDQYSNPASAAEPFYEQVSRDAGYPRDPAKINKTNIANEVWFMTIAAQHLCNFPAPAAPPPVTVTPAPTTSASQVPSGPTIGDQCADWMKFATDPLSGEEMLCGGYSENLSRGEPTRWYSAEEGAVGPSDGAADLPRVGRLGSSCAGEVSLTTGRSSDGYMVMCVGGGPYDKPGTEPVWAKYSP